MYSLQQNEYINLCMFIFIKRHFFQDYKSCFPLKLFYTPPPFLYQYCIYIVY